MNNSHHRPIRLGRHVVAAAAAITCGALVAGTAVAAPYASSVTQSGGNVNFVLNEASDNVRLVFDGGARIENLGSLGAGTYSVPLGANSSYDIEVRNTAAAAGYTLIDSVPFWSPKGISVNKLPSTANFGDLYISESDTGTPAGTTVDREFGFYKLNAARVQEDHGSAGITRGGTSTLYKTTIGPDGTLYNADLTSDLAYQIGDDLDSHTVILDGSNVVQDGTVPWVNSIAIHGTGANRQLFMANGNYNDIETKGVIRYDFSGSRVTSGDTGTVVVDTGGVDTFFASDIEVDTAGNIYVAVNRFDPGQANPITKFDSAGNEIFSIPATYTGANSLALSEELGYVAYASYYDGMVYVFSTEDGSFVTEFDAGGQIRDLAFDVLGNLYTVSNTDELLNVYALGTSQTAITGSDGTFLVTAVPEPATAGLLGLVGLAALRRRRA